MLGGGKVKAIYTLHGQGRSIRSIAETLGISRNTVRRYLRSEEVPRPAPRPRRGSKLDPYLDHIHKRLADGVENCVVLLDELRALGYTGGYTILKDYVQPLRRRREPQATVRFDTPPGDQAQVDFGRVPYRTVTDAVRWYWVFVLTLSWSRAMYLELLAKADLAAFIGCHVRAFTYLGGVPRRCLYDRTKLVWLEDDRESGQPVWNERFWDFSLRLGFELQLCRAYRAQTKGKVESGIKYVKGNFWPRIEAFTDLADLNRQALDWLDTVANVRRHGTTGERPVDRLQIERPHLGPLPPAERLAPFLRQACRIQRDGYVQYERGYYGVPWPWKPGQQVEVQPADGLIQIWSGDVLLAVHARVSRPGERRTHPRQWAGLRTGDGRPRPEPMPRQLPQIEVEQRPLAAYAALAEVSRL